MNPDYDENIKLYLTLRKIIIILDNIIVMMKNL